jgi:hypothetical protein
MSNRIGGLLVVMEKDMHEDDIEGMKKALFLMKGVIDVTSVNGGDFSDICAANRERAKLKDKLIELYKTL